MKRKCAFHVLGCKVNQNEVEALKNIFRQAGYEVVPFEEEADVYVIHTCTVTHISDRKSRQFIRKAIKQNPQAVVAVSGCYAQIAPEEIIKIPGVDVIIGTGDRQLLVDLVEQALNKKTEKPIVKVKDTNYLTEYEELPLTESNRARAFIKIQEGCDNFCTYCIIPYARGPLRSRDPQRTLEEITNLVKKGYLEIVLTGIHTAKYGKDLPDENIDLAWLLKKITAIEELQRLRVSSIDPDDFTPRLLRVMTDSTVICPHFHIPLQSGDDNILKKMGRRYTVAEYAALVNKIRKSKPEAAITTDIMVGFPGEGEREFKNTCEFIKEMAFSDLHVFKYSPRKGTVAAEFRDEVLDSVKHERSKKLISLARELFTNFARGFLGRSKKVLIEREINGTCEGHTDNYLPVRFTIPENSRGLWRMVNVKLEKVEGKKVIGSYEDRR